MGKSQTDRPKPETEHHDSIKSSIKGQDQVAPDEANTGGGIPDEQIAISGLDTASYIHDMSIELKSLAEKANFSFLAYLLHLAIEESAAQQRGRMVYDNINR